jgi:hypothetical protein
MSYYFWLGEDAELFTRLPGFQWHDVYGNRIDE